MYAPVNMASIPCLLGNACTAKMLSTPVDLPILISATSFREIEDRDRDPDRPPTATPTRKTNTCTYSYVQHSTLQHTIGVLYYYILIETKPGDEGG